MPMFYYFDPMYFLILAPGILLSLYATIKVKGTFSRYTRVPNAKGLSGAEAAAMLLQRSGVSGVRIEPARGGGLSDHYDPRGRVLRLSPQVFGGRSISSVAVAAHEAGHAIQHASQYAPLMLRSAAVPVVNFGSSLSWILIIGGMVLSYVAVGAEGGRWAFLVPYLLWAGVLSFGAVVLFQVITLPVEFNASRRAKERLVALGIVTPAEEKQVAKVLSAAAMTYVAAALTALLTLLYYMIRLGLLGGRRSS